LLRAWALTGGIEPGLSLLEVAGGAIRMTGDTGKDYSSYPA
jgi:hypothetical protein